MFPPLCRQVTSLNHFSNPFSIVDLHSASNDVTNRYFQGAADDQPIGAGEEDIQETTPRSSLIFQLAPFYKLLICNVPLNFSLNLHPFCDF